MSHKGRQIYVKRLCWIGPMERAHQYQRPDWLVGTAEDAFQTVSERDLSKIMLYKLRSAQRRQQIMCPSRLSLMQLTVLCLSKWIVTYVV